MTLPDIAPPLLRWYEQNKRTLPFRTVSICRVKASEITIGPLAAVTSGSQRSVSPRKYRMVSPANARSSSCGMPSASHGTCRSSARSKRPSEVRNPTTVPARPASIQHSAPIRHSAAPVRLLTFVPPRPSIVPFSRFSYKGRGFPIDNRP